MTPSSRIRLLLGLAAGSLTGLANAGDFTVERVALSLQRPVTVTHAPGDATRLFVAEKPGRIRFVRNGSVVNPAFLDHLAFVNDAGEGGLLGLAFHPDYENNGYFYISYTAGSGNGDSVVSRFSVSASDPDLADPASETIIWGPLPQQHQGHKAGDLHFGPDGKLYLSIGDGSVGGDPDNHAQDLTDPRGKILRFDVDLPWPHIPTDNPFLSDPAALDEIWSLGLRNPWRFSIDSATGDMYIGDVGQSAREEISFEAGGSPGGTNFGWKCREGTTCFGTGNCSCTNPILTDPVHEYDHTDGCSVIGGMVYRGTALPGMVGRYIFADFCTWRMWSFEMVGGVATDLREHTADLDPGDGTALRYPAAFGEGIDGEIYVVHHYGGELWKIVPDCGPDNYCTANANSSGSAASMTSTGSASVSSNDLTLFCTSAPSGQFGLFFYGPGQTQFPLGDGVLCVTGGIYRLSPPVMTSGSGSASRALDIAAPPSPAGQITPGSSWNFQFWVRDPGFGTSGYNLSDGLSVTFCP